MKKYSNQKEESSLPDGGYGWIIVGFSFLVLFISVGIVLSFGTFQELYSTIFPESSKFAIAFIGSSQIASIGLFGIPFGRLMDLFGQRILCFTGAVIMALSLLLASYSTAYYQVLLTQGLLYSMGCSLSYYAALTIIPQYFDKRKGLAMGFFI